MKVLLVDMPFAGLERPALNLSLLKARLAEDGMACDLLYANMLFAAVISPQAYVTIAEQSPDRSLAGEWAFVDDVFGRDEERSERYVRHVLAGMPQGYLEALRHARASAAAFLDSLAAAIDWTAYDIVGFTSCGDQNLASMALARRLKRDHPALIIMVGGANWHGGMGVAQLRVFPFVDIAFLGEAETALPAVIRALSEHGSATGIGGVAVRDSTGSAGVQAIAPSLDAVPTPILDDYFTALATAGLASDVRTRLSLETSRGCWWAERRPCSFCGLSGPVRSYRVKPPARVLRELRDMAACWPGYPIDIVDNVVPPSFLAEVLPELVGRPLGARLFFEARPSLTRRDIETIAAAGASVQVGIESLSDRVLRLMHKGTTVVEIVRLLRECRTAGISPAWNIILGTPGEGDEDYRDMIDLLPSLRGLPPPQVCAPFTLVRFSPLFESFRQAGFREVRPSMAYRLTYPVSGELLWGLAATFDYDEDLSLVRRALRYRLRAEVRAWQSEWQSSRQSASRADVQAPVSR